MIQSLHTLPYQKESWRRSENNIPSRLDVIDLNEAVYLKAYRYQKRILEGINNNILSDTLIFCQHPHTFTSSRLAKKNNLLISKHQLKKEGIDFFIADRGGDITYHGPGQLVIYPIFDLRRHKKDLKLFIMNLEQVIIDFLKEFGIISRRRIGYIGVWTANRKIASIGIGVKRWVSFHGLAINLNTDLKFFSMIRPCGLEIEMTSLKKELNKNIDFNLAKEKILKSFIKIFYENST